MQFVLKSALISLVLVGVVLADGIKPYALANDGAVTRDRHLSEISDIMRGGRGGYIDFGFYYTPSREQLPLESLYGEHDGFAFNHHFAAFGAGEVAKNRHMGALLWFDRSGWDGEDFFLFPQYNDFGLQRSVVTWGLTFTDARMNWTLAAGMQHQNLEHRGKIYPYESDSLAYSWAHLRFSKLSAQANFYRTDWRLFRVSLDLESRAIYGGRKSGPLTYLPNVSLSMYNTDDESDLDSMRITWEQNLYAQQLYAEVSADLMSDSWFHSAALKFYPDPSRMIGFEATCLRRDKRKVEEDRVEVEDDWLWGGAIDLLFARFAYNAAYDYDNFFGAKGTFLVEFKFNLTTIDGWLFNRGAARSAPMETDIIKQYDKKTDSGEITPIGAGKGAPKTIEAKGIRYEKAENTGSAEGGN
ncbi:hypothetical protein SAMN05720473_103133 [Fibrobacter sp. UWB15]|uniref:hypothetical protein n=1 Tax=unclassified Fibrobacter TaxID=2634177 RepID=UPI000920B388|nr:MULTISPECIES: hypothetical protein [unclassified Fibrobacter]PWJ65729.1 hypothetical protein BGW99_103133 [Fibrobacter sp. UWB6]SHF94889.1 hypothetical protein SAMN05720760_102135 [Fibrobacter sp. UWB8]SMG25427.1 hypothetical protein SAMN05720473_103133 [Fibrobacter sp. UWB15]